MTVPRRHFPGQFNTKRCRGAYTLLEVVLGIFITSIISGAVLSSMVLAGGILGKNQTLRQNVRTGADVAQRITADLFMAENITLLAENEVAMVVPDRDGDGESESISYSWSGQAGDALMYQYNGSEPVELVRNVHRFSLTSLLGSTSSGQSTGEEEQQNDSQEGGGSHRRKRWWERWF